MLRRGGHHHGGEYPPEIVDSKVQAIRAVNARKPGGHEANSKVNAGADTQYLIDYDQHWSETMTSQSQGEEIAMREGDEVSEEENAIDEQWGVLINTSSGENEASGTHGDFISLSCDALENGLRNIPESISDWVNEWEGRPALQRDNADRVCSPEEKGLNEWWGEEHRTISTRLSQKIKKLMIQSERPSCGIFVEALETMETQCAPIDSEESSVYLKTWEKQKTCGKAQSNVIWDAVAESGDVWTQQFSVGNLNLAAVDYGDQAVLIKHPQQAFGGGEPAEENQCAIASSAAAIERNAQRRGKRIHSGNRATALDA